MPTPRYFSQDFRGAERHHRNDGIGCAEWFHFASGAALLLIRDGTWQTGGRFRLYWLRPGSPEPVQMTWLLQRNEYAQGSHDTWDRVNEGDR